jgi:hypothetical protein
MPGVFLSMPDFTDLFTQYGLAGLVIAALFSFVIFLIKEHRAERDEWRTFYKDSVDQSFILQKETNEVIRELSSVIRVSNERGRRYE